MTSFVFPHARFFPLTVTSFSIEIFSNTIGVLNAKLNDFAIALSLSFYDGKEKRGYIIRNRIEVIRNRMFLIEIKEIPIKVSL